MKNLGEEIGIIKSQVDTISIGEPLKIIDDNINMTWITWPCLAHMKEKPKIKLDGEHTEYEWIKSEQLTDYMTVPDLHKSWERINKKVQVKPEPLTIKNQELD